MLTRNNLILTRGRNQACLLAHAAVCHAAANAGLGRHTMVVAMEDPNKVIDVSLLCHIGQSLAIMACTLGKTSFAITLMRIFVQRWLKGVLWFVIVTMNVVNILAALFVFLQCKDPRNLWDETIPSECWPIDIFTNFSLFVGGKSVPFRHSNSGEGLEFLICSHFSTFSIFRGAGFRSCSAIMDHYLGSADEEEGKVRSCSCYEHGYLVGWDVLGENCE